MRGLLAIPDGAYCEEAAKLEDRGGEDEPSE